jgi:hypothetical protein
MQGRADVYSRYVKRERHWPPIDRYYGKHRRLRGVLSKCLRSRINLTEHWRAASIARAHDVIPKTP